MNVKGAKIFKLELGSRPHRITTIGVQRGAALANLQFFQFIRIGTATVVLALLGWDCYGRTAAVYFDVVPFRGMMKTDCIC